MKINNELLNDIRKYSLENASTEVCGFIVEKNNIVSFISVENKHPENSKFFIISPKDYLKIKNNYKILYFFHSHADNPNFSELDIFYQKYHNIDMLIYNISTNEIKEMKCK